MLNNLIIGIFLSLFSAASIAQSAQLTIVIPYAAGSATDNLGRALSAIVTEQTGIITIVVNKPGAAGTIGARMVAESNNESTVLFTEQTTVYTNKLLKLPNSIDINRLKIVTAVSNGYTVLVVPKKSPFNTVQELINFIKHNPEKSIYAGAGMTQIMQSKNLFTRAGITDNIDSILSKNLSDIQSMLIREDITFAFLPLSYSLALRDADKLKILAIDFDTRSTLFPNIPTISEIYGPFSFTSWHGIYISNNVPESIRRKLNTIWKNAVNSPEFAKILQEQDRVKLGYSVKNSEKFFNEQLDYTIKLIDKNIIHSDVTLIY